MEVYGTNRSEPQVKPLITHIWYYLYQFPDFPVRNKLKCDYIGCIYLNFHDFWRQFHQVLPGKFKLLPAIAILAELFGRIIGCVLPTNNIISKTGGQFCKPCDAPSFLINAPLMCFLFWMKQVRHCLTSCIITCCLGGG